MDKRYVSIWFRYLNTDWFALKQPHLKTIPFALRTPSHGRMIITGVNSIAFRSGIQTGMVLADARAIYPDLEVQDDKPELAGKLLKRLAEWCIRFSPMVAVDLPDGLLIDASGCSHLWGGDENYVTDLIRKLNGRGYNVRVAMADTAGAAWAMARYGNHPLIIEKGKTRECLLPLPPESLRLETEIIDKLHRLGLHQVRQFIEMPRASLRRRFGPALLQRIDNALGQEIEMINPVQPPEPYQERLPCLEPITTASGIEIALKETLTALCHRLQQEQKGLRIAIFKGYRIDGKTEKIEINTNRPSYHVHHLFKLFDLKIQTIEPGLGIELFCLEAPVVEDYVAPQGKMWENIGGLDDIRLSELLDRLAGRIGKDVIHRYLPAEHYWPERAICEATSIGDKTCTEWRTDKTRPLRLLATPEKIEVSAPIPDYPPMLFRHQGKVHKIARADGPERIEQEWWLQHGQHRDYYRVEDDLGQRYWIFRLGHYDDKVYQWFLHGYFA